MRADNFQERQNKKTFQDFKDVNHKNASDSAAAEIQQFRKEILFTAPSGSEEKTSSRFMYEPWRGRRNNHRE